MALIPRVATVTACVYACGSSMLVFAPGLRPAQDVQRYCQSVFLLGVVHLSAPPTQTSVPVRFCPPPMHSLHFNARLAVFLQDISWLCVKAI